MNNKCRRESIKAELTQFIEGQTHKSHCCILHGCKYGEKECPVVIGDIEQEEICEYCGIEGIKAVEELQEVRSQRIGVNELPPVKKDLQLLEEGAKFREKVVVSVISRGEKIKAIGRYIHMVGQWQVDGFSMGHKVVEWWPLPKDGTGNKQD